MIKKNAKLKKENARKNERSAKNTTASKPEYSLRLLIAVVEHGHAERIMELLVKFGIKFHIICHGEGTADSSLLQLLNLDKSAKDVIINVMETAKAADILQEIYNNYEGNGVAFTVKLTSIGGLKALQLITGDLSALNININKPETEKKEEGVKHGS